MRIGVDFVRIITLLYHHILSYYHKIILPYYHTIILSYCHPIILSYHPIIKSSYHHIMISSYHNIMWSWHHNTEWLKSFLVPSPGFRHILSRLPLLQGSLLKNKGSWGNNFLRRICWGGSKSHSSSKTSPFQKKKWPPKIFAKKKQKQNRRRKTKNCKSSETRFAKVSRRSELCSRGKRPFKVSKKKFKFASRRSKR